MLARTPEPELMDDPDQVRAYAEADFEQAHQSVVEHLLARFPALDLERPASVLDLGCGPADVTVRLARAWPGAVFVGVDGAERMLAAARLRLRREGLTDRVELRRAVLPDPTLAREHFDAVISNSLLHHLHAPEVLWDTIRRTAEPDAPVLVMDLRRPDDAATVDALVERHAAGEPEVLRRDLTNSLHAAFRPDEVSDQLRESGLRSLQVEAVGDRHLLVWGPAPGHPAG